jgi:hypothetical protein
MGGETSDIRPPKGDPTALHIHAFSYEEFSKLGGQVDEQCAIVMALSALGRDCFEEEGNPALIVATLPDVLTLDWAAAASGCRVSERAIGAICAVAGKVSARGRVRLNPSSSSSAYTDDTTSPLSLSLPDRGREWALLLTLDATRQEVLL